VVGAWGAPVLAGGFAGGGVGRGAVVVVELAAAFAER